MKIHIIEWRNEDEILNVAAFGHLSDLWKFLDSLIRDWPLDTEVLEESVFFHTHDIQPTAAGITEFFNRWGSAR